MKQLVIMPGGFHPFHAGHAALYQSAVEAFPGADVYVAATNDTSTRPFPFQVKEKLAQLAGVSKGRFMQVKSPFRAEEITAPYDPNTTQLIFVRSEKDRGSQPRPGGVKKDGTPGYLQPYDDASDLPMSQQAYMDYLPTVEFGPGMTSATEIRGAWPQLNEKRKTALVMSLYPKTQTNPKLAATVVKLLDTALEVVDESALDNLPRPNKRNQFKSLHKQRKQRGLDEQGMAEGDVIPFARPGQQLTWRQVPRNILLLANDWYWADYASTGNELQYITAKLQQQGWTIDHNDENDSIDEYNLILTNRRGQTVLLSTNDAQTFTGWASGTGSDDLKEFATAGLDGGDDGGDEKSYLLQLAEDLSEAMYGPNKNKQAIDNVMGKIRAAGGDVKVTWNADRTFNVAMYHPVYFKQGYLIRLVGQGDQDVAENTAPNPRVDLTPNYPNYSTLVGEFIGVKKNRVWFRIVSAELKPGQGETEKIFRAMSTNTPIGVEISRVKNRAVLENIDKEFILYIDGKPAAKYMDQQQAVLDMAAVRKKYPSANLELKHEVCNMQTVKQVNEGGSILEVLKPDAFKTLQQAKQNIKQNRQQEQQAKQQIEPERQQEVDQWVQDFRANSAKLAGQQLKQRFAEPPPEPPTMPVVRPGESPDALRARLAQLSIVEQKFEEINALIKAIKNKYQHSTIKAEMNSIEKRLEIGLLPDVKAGVTDNYKSLLAKLDNLKTSLATRFPPKVKKDPDYIEEGRKI